MMLLFKIFQEQSWKNKTAATESLALQTGGLELIFLLIYVQFRQNHNEELEWETFKHG